MHNIKIFSQEHGIIIIIINIIMNEKEKLHFTGIYYTFECFSTNVKKWRFFFLLNFEEKKILFRPGFDPANSGASAVDTTREPPGTDSSLSAIYKTCKTNPPANIYLGSGLPAFIKICAYIYSLSSLGV